MLSLIKILHEWVRVKKSLFKQLKNIKMSEFRQHSQLIENLLWFLNLKAKDLNSLKMKVSSSQKFKKNPIYEDHTFSLQVLLLERIHTMRKSLFLMKPMKTFRETQKSKKFISVDLTERMKGKCTYFRSILMTSSDLNKKI